MWSIISSGIHVKYPLFLSDFSETWIFSSFSKNIQILNFVKICRMRAGLFHADGRTDRHDNGNSRFSQFCEPPLMKRNLISLEVKWSKYINFFTYIYIYVCVCVCVYLAFLHETRKCISVFYTLHNRSSSFSHLKIIRNVLYKESIWYTSWWWDDESVGFET